MSQYPYKSVLCFLGFNKSPSLHLYTAGHANRTEKSPSLHLYTAGHANRIERHASVTSMNQSLQMDSTKMATYIVQGRPKDL